MKSYFILFSCCIPVKGASRSTVCDLQRNMFQLIPNVLYEILTEHAGKSIQELFEAYDHEHDEEIAEYLDFLVKHEYGFYSEEHQRFPRMDLNWHNPLPVTNAIVDFDGKSTHSLSDIVSQLSAIRCAAIELRFFHAVPFKRLEASLKLFEDTAIRGVQVIAGYHRDQSLTKVRQLLQVCPRVQRIYIHSAPQDVVDKATESRIVFSSQKVDSEACCGNVLPQYFVANVPFFTEAQTFSTCLNRKISIDRRGAIKNCPSMVMSYGQVGEVALKEVIDQLDFKKVWHINKDQVLVCRDCEFRYMCHDCRAYLSDPDNLYSKPAKCTYDPYHTTWEQEEPDPKGLRTQ